jgi:hypothetical protein
MSFDTLQRKRLGYLERKSGLRLGLGPKGVAQVADNSMNSSEPNSHPDSMDEQTCSSEEMVIELILT